MELVTQLAIVVLSIAVSVIGGYVLALRNNVKDLKDLVLGIAEQCQNCPKILPAKKAIRKASYNEESENVAY